MSFSVNERTKIRMDIGEFKLVEMDIQKSRSCSLSALDDLGGQMLC